MIAVIPMAGRGSRFSSVGFETPKPLIPVAGKPMVLWSLKSLESLALSSIVFVILKEHEERFSVTNLLKKSTDMPIQIVMLDDVTEGQLCTVLAAREFIDTSEDVLIAASDTFVESDLHHDISGNWDGLISVANLPGEQWSFARTNDQDVVVEVAEKKRISDHASTGLYYFKRGIDIIRFGDAMIRSNERTRGEFYVIPVYQKLIDAGYRIGISQAHSVWDMGTPEAKSKFEKYLGA